MGCAREQHVGANIATDWMAPAMLPHWQPALAPVAIAAAIKMRSADLRVKCYGRTTRGSKCTRCTVQALHAYLDTERVPVLKARGAIYRKN